MKKIISVLCAIAILCSMSVTAFAAVPDKEARAAFKESVAIEKQKLIENRAQLKALAEEKKALSTAYKAILKADKNAETPTISAETHQQIKDLLEELKAARASGEDTKGKIKEILTANKENIKNMDYEAAVTAFKNVAAVQNERLEKKTSIIKILKQINDILS
ncbi:hypothetical protein V6615_04465 [Oscillospiraceae bacterium PP1C4]